MIGYRGGSVSLSHESSRPPDQRDECVDRCCRGMLTTLTSLEWAAQCSSSRYAPAWWLRGFFGCFGYAAGTSVSTNEARLRLRFPFSARCALRSYSSAVRMIAAFAPGRAVSPSAIVRISCARCRHCSGVWKVDDTVMMPSNRTARALTTARLR